MIEGRGYSALLLSLLIDLAVGNKATACTCMPSPPPIIALTEADAVFEGVVIDIAVEAKASENPNSISSNDLMRIRFRVLQAWKGLEVNETVVFTARDSASCGYVFQIGSRYIVYARSGERGLITGCCSRTSLVSKAHTDFRDLGTAKWEASP